LLKLILIGKIQTKIGREKGWGTIEIEIDHASI
jgi:hypothetical protein